MNGTHRGQHYNGGTNLEIAQSNQELLSAKRKRKKRTWIIAGIVSVIIIGLIVASIVFLSNGKTEKIGTTSKLELESLALEDLLGGKFYPTPFNGTWISDSEILYTDVNSNLILKDVKHNNSTVLLAETDPIAPRVFDSSLSADKKYLLVSEIVVKLYRYSQICRYSIIDLKTGQKSILKIGEIPDFQLVVWSPVGDSLVAIYRNNIFYFKNPFSPPLQITNDNQFVFNGIPDWVYEEEVLNSNKALWFSPDGKKLAYGKYNEAEVPVMILPYYGEPGNLNFQYPRPHAVKYPKAGAKNPTVSLHVVELENPTLIRKLEAPADLAVKQPILTAVSWATDDVVSAIWMNRVQNESSLITYETKEPYTIQTLKKLRQSNGWLELFTPLKFSKDGSKFILILSSKDSNSSDSYRHLILFNRTQNAEPEPLTKGRFTVIEIVSWDEQDNLIYYLANSEEDTATKHVYSISTKTKQVKCLSCRVKGSLTKSECLYNSVHFSKNHSYYILSCDGPDVPDTRIFSKNMTEILIWEDNDGLFNLTRTHKRPNIKRFIFNVTEGFQAPVIMKLPPDMDMSGSVKYPLMINVYGGPDSAQVTHKFNLDWGSYLAANKSIIYASIDGRGSGLLGDKMLFANYRHLGTSEVEDQISVTRQMQNTLPYVDPSRTAIWGWSYGGYAAGMALATDKDVFKCGISVAPVTDWTLYDTIYTERFMGLPTVEDNLKGYVEAQLISKFEGIREKKYFLIHGTFDDNVHFQQSIQWAKVLEQADIQFRQVAYADQAHDLGAVRPHLYHSMENFLDECFIDRDAV